MRNLDINFFEYSPYSAKRRREEIKMIVFGTMFFLLLIIGLIFNLFD